MTKIARRLAGAPWLSLSMAVAVGVIAASVRDAQAHKAVTSKYDYNKDVYPLLRDHCGQCHITGGPAPMTLLTYKDAVSWAEAIRDELSTERMPPWPLDPEGPAVRGAHTISAKDVDTIVTWASGGTPHGDLTVVIPEATFKSAWKLGEPDLKVAMDTPHTVAPGTLDETLDFTLPTGLTEAKWVKAVDLLPGMPTLVRDAVVSVENGPVLALWQPGTDPVAAPTGAAFKLAAGAKLHLQIHYKKHYDAEQEATTDKSTIGLYFTDAPASGRELQALSIDGGAATDEPIRRLSANLSGAGRVVAVRPLLDQPYESVAVTADSPSGARVPLLMRHNARPQWFRRYWLETPVEVAAGSKIEVAATPLPPNSDEPKTPKRFPLQVSLDYVAQ